jgi:hypothetical protein
VQGSGHSGIEHSLRFVFGGISCMKFWSFLIGVFLLCSYKILLGYRI